MNEATERLVARLTSALGADAVLVGADRERYRVQGSPPKVVALPGTVEQVSATLAAATETHTTVIPWGSGSRMAIGYPPRATTLVLSLERLNQVLAHDPADLTVSVQAGCTHAQVDQHLAAAGQMLPLDVPLPERATIGGTIATGMAGPRRALYGGPRDLLLGVRAVDASGTMTHAGGRVVKNVTGYDLTKLYLGSLGTLAVLVEANFKLLPLPEAEATVAVVCGSTARALSVAEGLSGLAVAPAAVCVLAGATAQVLCARQRLAPGATLVLARYPGTASAVARAVDGAAAVAQASGGAQVARLDGQEQTDGWATVRDFTALVDQDPDEAVLKVHALPSELASVIEAATKVAEEHGLRLDWLADVCVGVVYLKARPDDDAPAARKEEPALDPGLLALQGMLAHRWRSAVVLSCAPALKARLPLWGADPPGLDLMRAIKRQFDPAGLLNPGRFVGEL